MLTTPGPLFCLQVSRPNQHEDYKFTAADIEHKLADMPCNLLRKQSHLQLTQSRACLRLSRPDLTETVLKRNLPA